MKKTFTILFIHDTVLHTITHHYIVVDFFPYNTIDILTTKTINGKLIQSKNHSYWFLKQKNLYKLQYQPTRTKHRNDVTYLLMREHYLLLKNWGYLHKHIICTYIHIRINIINMRPPTVCNLGKTMCCKEISTIYKYL